MLVERKEHIENDGSVGYIESIFDSANILKSTYFPTYNRLYLTFGRGHTYSYENFDIDTYTEFEKCESQGTYFQKNINKSKKYVFRKEFQLFPLEIADLKKIISENREIDDEE